MNANTSSGVAIERIPHSWESEDHEPEDLRSNDELAADDAGISSGEF